MITLITGAPGTGKTAALVSLLFELGKNRAIYCDGIPDLKLDHVELAEPTKWHESVPDGSIIVIDEVQRVWRPRGPGSKVPADIAALETHRHRGLDFYIITQSPRLVDTNVRGLVGRHVHLRDLGILGRMWYEWPECSESCSSAWKQAPLKKRYRLPKAIFAKYKSASEHIKPVRSVPWMLAVMLFALLITAVLSFKAYQMITGKMGKPSEAFKPPATVNDITSRQVSAPAELPVSPYDENQFIPRVSNRPESAPAYDGIRTVVAMPTIAGCVSLGSKCKCFTEQGTDAGLSPAECKSWLSSPPYNPYMLARSERRSDAPASSSASHPQSASPSQPAPWVDRPAFQREPETRTTARQIG